MKSLSKFSIVCVLVFSAFSVRAADSTMVNHTLGVTTGGAYVLPTNRIVRGQNAFGAKTRSAFATAAEYSFSFGPNTRYGKLYPTSYQGIGLGINGFQSNRTTGTPINIYVLQGATIAKLAPRLSLDYQWNFGISAGWHKNTSSNPYDYTEVDGYGSSANAYINLGLRLKYALSSRLTLSAGIDVSHFSNGNTDYPNPGVNLLWGRLGLAYTLGKEYKLQKTDWSSFKAGWATDITAYGAWRKHTFDSNYVIGLDEADPKLIPGHFGVAGLNINPLYRFNPVFAAGAAADFQYDEGANLSPYYADVTPADDPRFYRQPFEHRCMAGISARAELTMPIFSINIGIGHSLYAPGGEDLRGWYQIFTLKTFITSHLYLSTGYRLVNFKNPGNLMLGAGWRFH